MSGLESNAATGNLDQVRGALQGTTGVAIVPRIEQAHHVVMARMNRELDTVDSLRRMSIRAYWPNYERMMPSKGRQGGRRRLRVGIVPGYVFTPLDPRLDFEQLLDMVVGALDLVRTYSGNPWLIPDRYIRELRKIEIGLNTPQPEGKVAHAFKRGHKVRFPETLVDIWPPGVIDRLADDGRISVEVELMGRKVPIWVLPHQIERM